MSTKKEQNRLYFREILQIIYFFKKKLRFPEKYHKKIVKYS